ncbi:MAG: tRNA guanosine-2'-O-methyltransferase [Bacillariaceae sp.]|jgi:tRNA guanosine-2'-O-methyltransferase
MYTASSITPSDAIKPLFDCIVISSRRWICASSKYDDPKKVEILYIENLTKIIKVLLSLIKQSTRSRESAYMLNDFCALIFQAGLLREEYDRIQQDPACSDPIRDGFRQLIKMAGRYRPHVTRAVLCRITVAWMGDNDSDDKADAGVSAIPYRDDIVQLLLHKEAKKDESASNQSAEEIPTSGVTEIPANTNYLSITRAFLLVFFTRLPGPDAGGLNPIVKTELTHHVILALLQQSTPEKGTHPKLVMKGTPTYCMKIRGWQALCIMSRFVTNEVAQKVCTTVFDAMNELLHSQIRYFLENFTIKCATNHQDIFGEAFLKEISRTDLSLQHISSLMILGGNFIMGKYQLDYFTKHDDNKQRLKRVLAGAIPWLSSTQGFSRAIAQLMVYQLIPKVVDVTTDGSPSSTSTTIEDSDWFLKSTYNFLDQNREMKRLRSKQTKFFERYDCDKMCTPEGVFSIQMDEALEANPVHLIDAMKESLRSTYDEAHESDAPSWKQVEELMTTDSNTDDGTNGDDNTNNMIQRKIIPLDSLNLALEDLREQRLTNAKGSQKQELIVCASLVDKIPNLAGLARTSEIFAAQSLIVPDLSVTKMDIFQSISVGAADWIDIQEVKEEVREYLSREEYNCGRHIRSSISM